MIRPTVLCLVGMLVILLIHQQAEAQATKGRDYPPFVKIDGFSIFEYKDIRFNAYEMPSDSSGKKVHVEGHQLSIYYTKNNDGQGVSSIEIMRTAEEQAKSAGQIVYHGDLELVARFDHSGTPIWVDYQMLNISPGGEVGAYSVVVVEEKAFHPPTPENRAK